MKPTIHGRRPAPSDRPFTLNMTVAALAAAGVLSSASVWARQAPAATEPAAETAVVVVSGVRRAAQTAQKIKQEADDVIDSIVADDIGKFPDTNVAQTLARVSGIQVRRDAGEANTVLIRGLPGIATMLNGREMFTTTGRYIQLADIPSTMLQRVDVYKSQNADLVEGGIAGVIDVRTNRPFDFKGLTMSATAGVKNQDKAHKTDPEGSAMISNRWKTGAGEFGALFGISYVKNNFFEERSFNTFPIQKDWLLPNLTGPDLVGLQAVHGERERAAQNIALQWKPNADLELYAEGINTNFKIANETDFFVGLPWWANVIGATKIPGTDQLDTLSSRDANTILSTQAHAAENKTSQFAIGARWKVTPSLRVNAEIARTNSSYAWKNPILDVIINVPRVELKTNVDGSAYMEYTGKDLSNPANSNLFALFDRYGNDKGSSTDWRADAIYLPENEGFFKEFSGGLRANQRKAESIKSFEGSLSAPGYRGAWEPIQQISAASIPGLNCTAPALSQNYGTSGWYTPCAEFMRTNTDVVRQAVTGTSAPRGIDPGSFFSDEERNIAFYGKAKVGFSLGSIPVDGVLGVRVSKTDADLVGKSLLNGAYVDTPTSNSGTEVLPSASFKLDLRDGVIGRLAYAKTLTRPDFAQLNPGTAYVASNGNTVQASASGGNPALKPFTGQNLDAAVEWYFAPTGMISGTVFRHNFDGYIMSRTQDEVFQGVTYSTARPFNSDKGHLQGLEIAYQQFYDKLPGWLGGLGLQMNATYTEGGVTSSVNPDLAGKPFAGLSKFSYNIVGLYERGPVSGRLAYNWRSKFVQIYGDRPGNAGTSPARDMIAAPMSSLDGSLSYKITQNLSVNLTGTNLLNFKYVDYWTDKDIFPRDTRRYDRSVGLSLAWRN
ncbi:MAG: TonB-dependent receptor [Pseudomonadota bacterium]